jgi:hypothetical protein
VIIIMVIRLGREVFPFETSVQLVLLSVRFEVFEILPVILKTSVANLRLLVAKKLKFTMELTCTFYYFRGGLACGGHRC